MAVLVRLKDRDIHEDDPEASWIFGVSVVILGLILIGTPLALAISVAIK